GGPQVVPRRQGARADAHGVRAARAVPSRPRARPLAFGDPHGRLGLRLRPEVELARGLCRVPAAEARSRGRAPAAADGSRRRLRPAGPAVTLSRRVVVLTSVAVGAIALLVSVLAYLLVRHELYARLDRTLDERALALRSEARAESTAQRLSIVAAPGELVQVLRADGRVTVPLYQVTRL